MKKSIIFVIISLFSVTTFAQHFYAGLLAGGSNYLGDLSENSSRIIIGETKLAGGCSPGTSSTILQNLNWGSIMPGYPAVMPMQKMN